jgi:hypothetical protein
MINQSMRKLSLNCIAFGRHFNCQTKLLSSSSILRNNNPNAKSPLIDQYRPVWPDQDFSVSSKPATLPKRTIPDDVLNFKLSATFTPGSSIFYPHLSINPADLKVVMTVS